MLSRLALAALLAGLPAGAARAESAPLVVVELFTAQGCPACPPANRLFERLSERADVLPLAFHVDYWDYLGWRDAFGRPENTARQKAYARAAGQKTVYTPHFVVGGAAHLAGVNEMALAETILAHAAQPRAVTVGLAREGDTLKVLAVATDALDPGRPMVVQVVRFTPSETVTVLGGENARLTTRFVNIVRSLEVVARWDGAGPLALSLPAPGPDRAAVIVQAEDAGPILGAAVLR